MDTHVIHVDLEPFFCNHVCTDVVHKRLEGGGWVGESKEHDCWFVKSQGGDERCLPLVLFSQSDVVVSPLYVKLGEEGRVLHVVDKFRNEG